MATPTGKGERTRRALVDAAIVRFARDGSRGASVSEIARDVGITPASVYAYFPNKEALFLAALDADAERLMQRAVDAIGEDLAAEWMAVLLVLVTAVDEHPLARRVLSGGEGMSADRLLVIPAEAAFRQRLADSVRQGQARGRVRSDIDVERFASGFTTLLLSLLIASLQTGGGAGDDDRLSGVVAVLDASLRPPPDRR